MDKLTLTLTLLLAL